MSDWSPERVRRNFRIDLFSGICAGVFISVLIAFMPVVVRRMGGSAFDVALVVSAPFFGHLVSPLFVYLLSGLQPVRVVAGAVTLSRLVFLGGVLVATTPLMLAVTSVTMWVVGLANIAAYTAVMAAIYPDSERAQAMGKVRMGVSVAAIAAAAAAGLLIDVVPASLVFAAATLISLPGALAFFAIRMDGAGSRRARGSAAAIARDIWRDRRYRRLLASFTVFGFGNLMNFAVIPIMLVDLYDTPNTFIGALTATQSMTAVAAYAFWGRLIDRGSSLRLHLYANLLIVLVPIGYLLAPSYWFLLPTAVVMGIVTAGHDLTFHTNIVQLAPPGRVLDYAAAQSFLLGVRGSIAPFVASALLAALAPRGVLVIGVGLMVVGLYVMSRAVRMPAPVLEVAPAAPAAPAT